MKLYQILEQQLKKEPNFTTDNGELKKWVVINKAQNFDEELLELLLTNDELKSKFFKTVANATVFNQSLFIQFLEQKNYLNDSYTQYKNKVGLTIDNKFLKQRNEVSLVWPFKDCILEGGQSREEDKREEIFFNEILAQDEITQLLDPKVLTNAKRFDVSTGSTQVGEWPFNKFNRNADGTITDNLIIKGNNLLALHTLKEEFAGKVKLIYIDPPYNTGNDGFKYNDSFNHSTWLTFMKNRLLVARELLKKDGVIFIQCDDNEQAYLKVLMDEVFGRENSLNIITVKTKIGGVSGSSEGKSLRDATEFILLYSKDKNLVELNPVFIKTQVNQYVNEYKESGKSWKYTQVLISLEDRILIKEEKNYHLYHYPNAKTTSIRQFAEEMKLNEDEVYTKYPNKIYRTTNAQSSVRTRVINEMDNFSKGIVSIEYTPQKGKNASNKIEVFYNASNKDMFMFLSEMLSEEKNDYYYLQKINTLWEDIQYNNLNKEGGYIEFANGKKPEILIQRVIELTTQENDIVLDYHLGSGTTASVAHKMNRQYIGIEQMDYIETVAVERLKKVIDGEQGGISKSVNWKGGGSFIYLELKKYNQTFIDQIASASSATELLKIWELMKEKSFLNYNVDIKKQDKHIEEFKALELAQQKQHLCELLNKNQLYVNRSAINDERFKCTEEEKSLNHDFYKI